MKSLEQAKTNLKSLGSHAKLTNSLYFHPNRHCGHTLFTPCASEHPNFFQFS